MNLSDDDSVEVDDTADADIDLMSEDNLWPTKTERFGSLDQIHSRLECYARLKGFQMSANTSKTNRYGLVKYKNYICNQAKSMNCKCHANFQAVFKKNGEEIKYWQFSQGHEEHVKKEHTNEPAHELTPEKLVQYLPKYRALKPEVLEAVEQLVKIDRRIKIKDVMNELNARFTTFSKSERIIFEGDVKNVMARVKRKKEKINQAEELLLALIKLKQSEEHFYLEYSLTGKSLQS
jgi:hypothetical protein